MKKTIMMCLGALLLLSACGTVQGIGDDIKNLGDDISDAAEKTKNTMGGSGK